MYYRWTIEVEQRLCAALLLIRGAVFLTSSSAGNLGACISNVLRYVPALGDRRYYIRVQGGGSCRYVSIRCERRQVSTYGWFAVFSVCEGWRPGGNT